MVSFENLPEIFYLGVYQPSSGECDDFDFIGYSSEILSLKNCEPSALKAFADCISSNLGNGFDCLAVVPSHYSGIDTSGIKLLSKEISRSMKLVDARSCLIRHENIERLSTGGDRSIETHLKSIQVANKELIEGKNVLLLDDISTTGNSLKACKQLLTLAGVKAVKSFVLGKTTRLGEDLELFERQYHAIQERIEEEANYSKEQSNQDAHSDYEQISYYHESEMERLSEAFHYGSISKEEYHEQSCGLDEHCCNLREDIYRKYEFIQGIDYDAECQIEKLYNLYNFPFL
jgi:hypoxanthine phosphoribosyltransferase